MVPRDALPDWINAIGLVLTALPESYWAVLNDRILKLIETLPPTTDIFQVRTIFHGLMYLVPKTGHNPKKHKF